VKLVDTSVFTGSWPFRYLKHSSLEELKAHLLARGVTQAWVADCSAIFQQDPMPANEDLLRALKDDAFFVPQAIIDVSLRTWRQDLRACRERWGCRVVKLTPGYHQYQLNDPLAGELAALAEQLGMLVSIQMRMVDERAQHHAVKVLPVSAADVVALAGQHPQTRFLACGAWRGNDLQALNAAPNVWVEISSVESGDTLRDAIEVFSPQRLVFGSHSPLYYFEAAAAKLDIEHAEREKEMLAAVGYVNATNLLLRSCE
jgi:uncharacterized protein